MPEIHDERRKSPTYHARMKSARPGTVQDRLRGAALAGAGMGLISTDALFVRAAGLIEPRRVVGIEV